VKVRHDEVDGGRRHHAVRPVEARGRALPICQARPPTAREGAGRASLGHEAQGVVVTIHHHHVANRAHRDAGRGVEARVSARPVLVSGRRAVFHLQHE
jgi:hypothetical protein